MSKAGGSSLFAPLSIGTLTVPGRLFKAATAETRASEDGFVTDELLEFYQPMARAGTPLIVTGNIYVSPDGRQSACMTGADDDDKIPGLRQLAQLVQRQGSRLFAQLNHCGRQVLPGPMGIEAARSASDVLEKTLCTRPVALTRDGIRRVIDQFAAAGRRCAEAGFDGIQVHAAHGYLINQFLTPYTNRRDDEYGGSLRNRARLLLESCQAIRARVGDRLPIIVKLNGSDALPLRAGLHTAELVEVARMLEAEGVAAVEISVGHYESGFSFIRGRFERYFTDLMHYGIGEQLPAPQRWLFTGFRLPLTWVCNRIWGYREGFNLRYARQFKAALSIPVICVGGFRSAAAMQAAIDDGFCDAVSCARAMIADPYLYRHLRDGIAGPECVYCNACIARAGRMPADCYHPEVGRRKAEMLARGNPS